MATTTQVGGFKITKQNVKELGEHIYGVKHSNDGAWLATSFGNGCVRVYNNKPKEEFISIGRSKLGGGYDDIPSTNVRFRPQCEASEEGVHELVVAASGGAVFGFNIDAIDPEEVFLDRSFRFEEKDNETACIDYGVDGNILASVGSDRQVRIYDINKRKLRDTLSKGHDEGGHSRPAHTNRIFCCKFINETTLVTAGWENPVQIWDMRTGKSERQIGGPHVSSDCVDVLPGTQHIIIGSSRPEKQIQVFDFLGCREITADSEKLSAPLENYPLAGLKFQASSKNVWAGTSKPHQVLCIDFDSGAVKGRAEVDNNILCMDVHPTDEKKCVVGGMKESLWCFESLA